MGQCPQCQSCLRGAVFLSSLDMMGPGAPEKCEEACEHCVRFDNDEVSTTLSAAPAELQVQTGCIVPCKNSRLLSHESNFPHSLLRALAGKKSNYDPMLHGTIVRNVMLVDASAAKALHSAFLKVSALLVINCERAHLKIVPDIFSALSNITIFVDKIEAIYFGEDSLSDPLCMCLDASEAIKAVLIQYKSECCEVRESVCFLLDSHKEQQSFAKALTAFWQNRRNHCTERGSLPQ